MSYRRRKYPMRRKRFNPYSRRFVNYLVHKSSINSGPIMHSDHTTNINPTNAGAVVVLGAVDQGVTEHTRRGEECRLLSIRGYFYATINAAATITTMRYIVFRSVIDQQGAPPAVTDVLESVHVNSQYKQDTKQNYIILLDKRFILDTTSRLTKTFSYYFNLKNVKQSYDNTTAADYTRGHIFHLYLSSEAINTPLLNGRIRTYLRSV